MVAGLTSVADSRAPAPRPGRHRPLARVVVTHPQAPALETAHHPPPRLASKRGARTPGVRLVRAVDFGAQTTRP